MFKSTTMPEFYQLTKQQKVNVLDVREPDEYRAGHIPGAISMPLSQLGNSYEAIDKSKPYYVICHSGNRSANASAFLGQEGYNVTNIMGGMMVWPGDIE